MRSPTAAIAFTQYRGISFRPNLADEAAEAGLVGGSGVLVADDLPQEDAVIVEAALARLAALPDDTTFSGGYLLLTDFTVVLLVFLGIERVLATALILL